MARYLVTDGEHLGRKQSEFLSLSPRAAFRLKKWFDKFDLEGEFTGIEVEDASNQVISPDLVGVDIIFKVYQDSKMYQGEYPTRVELVSVADTYGQPAEPQVEASVEPEPIAAAAAVSITPSRAAPPSTPVAPARRPLAAQGPARRTLK